jgi:integrase
MRISISRRNDYQIFRVKNSPYWQVKFWNFEKSKEACRRSTGILLSRPKAIAEKVARQLLSAGILAEINTNETRFISYLKDFWRPDGDYCRKAATVKGNPISPAYIKHNLADIRLHIETYKPFEKIRLANITTGDLERWQLWAREEHGITGNRLNSCLKIIKVALAQAVKNGNIPIDPSKAVSRAVEIRREKGILNQVEAAKVCSLPLDNPCRLLPVLLGLCCGMRRGEIRGLQWQDIQDGIIDIRHNFIDKEGIKKPKAGSFRKVPYGLVVANCIEAVKLTAKNTSPEAFVLESSRLDNKPITEQFFIKGLISVLSSIGISPEEQKRRNITPHSLRHSFISLARLAGVNDLTVQTLAGHKNLSMTDHYTHAAQAIDLTDTRKEIDGIWESKN